MGKMVGVRKMVKPGSRPALKDQAHWLKPRWGYKGRFSVLPLLSPVIDRRATRVSPQNAHLPEAAFTIIN